MKNHFDHWSSEAAVLGEYCVVVSRGGGFDGVLRCGRKEFYAAYEDALNGGSMESGRIFPTKELGTI